MALANGSGIPPQVWHWWIAIGCVVAAVVIVAHWIVRPPRRTPEAVKTLRGQHRTERTSITCRCGERFEPQTPVGKRAFVRHLIEDGEVVHRIGFAGPDTHVCGIDCPPTEEARNRLDSYGVDSCVGAPDVTTVRARHAAPEPETPDVPTPVEEPTEEVPANDGQGATLAWSPAAELAAVGEGELLPAGIPTVSIDDIPDADLIRPGTPTVSIDDFSDWELWDAEWDSNFARFDELLEEARRSATFAMVAAGCPLQVIQEIDRRDAESHERAVDGATALITMAVEPLARRTPHRVTPAIARRARKREHKALGGAR